MPIIRFVKDRGAEELVPNYDRMGLEGVIKY